MATVYSQQDNPSTGAYLRSVCTYTVTETNTQIIISGTIALQHNGAAYSGAFLSVSGVVGYNTAYGDITISGTDSITSAVKHTSWTTVKSKAFSDTFSKTVEARTLTLKVGLKSMVTIDNANTAAINIPALQSYPITFDSNGGSGGPTSQTKYEGVDLILSSSKPSKTDYIFFHWNTALNNSGTSYNPGDTYTANAALNLHAIWNSKISYDGNGVWIDTYASFPTQTKTYGTNLTLHSATPTRTGYVFNGWNTAADGTGTSYQPGGTYSAEVAVTLYAQWLSLPAKPVISSMTAIRWNETTNQQDDTGTSAKVTAEWSIDTTSDYYGNTNTGTVTLTVTPQSGSSSHTITPVSGTSGTSGTAVFMVHGLSTDMQYNCTITVTDMNASSNRTVILTRAFFIMDFKAGGKGIGIGRAAPNEGLEIGYEATFDDDVTMLEKLHAHVTDQAVIANGDKLLFSDSSNNGKIVRSSTAFDGTTINQLLSKKGTWELAADVPTSNTMAKYDSSKHLNSENMTSQELSDFFSSLNLSGAGLETTQADWIVEQGVDGIWTWRKWQSGIAECWGTYETTTEYTASTAAAGGYRAIVSNVAIPTIFTTAPTATATHNGGSSHYWGAIVNVSTDLSALSFTLDRGSAVSSGTIRVTFRLSGRWK